MTLLDALVVTTLQAGRLPAIDPAAISERRRSRAAPQAMQALPARFLGSLGNAVTRLRQRLGKLKATRMVEDG